MLTIVYHAAFRQVLRRIILVLRRYPAYYACQSNGSVSYNSRLTSIYVLVDWYNAPAGSIRWGSRGI